MIAVGFAAMFGLARKRKNARLATVSAHRRRDASDGNNRAPVEFVPARLQSPLRRVRWWPPRRSNPGAGVRNSRPARGSLATKAPRLRRRASATRSLSWRVSPDRLKAAAGAQKAGIDDAYLSD
jgi:hypothetical protein